MWARPVPKAGPWRDVLSVCASLKGVSVWRRQGAPEKPASHQRARPWPPGDSAQGSSGTLGDGSSELPAKACPLVAMNLVSIWQAGAETQSGDVGMVGAAWFSRFSSRTLLQEASQDVPAGQDPLAPLGLFLSPNCLPFIPVKQVFPPISCLPC